MAAKDWRADLENEACGARANVIPGDSMDDLRRQLEACRAMIDHTLRRIRTGRPGMDDLPTCFTGHPDVFRDDDDMFQFGPQGAD